MKSQLLFRDRSFDWSQPFPWNAAALEFDLSLGTLFDTMAQNDPVILASVKKVMLAAGSGDRDTILYRQSVLRDCLHHRPIIEELYGITNQAMEKYWSNYLGTLGKYPHWVLNDAVGQMEKLGVLLSTLRRTIDRHGHRFQADGWHAFFDRARRELSDSYFREMGLHLKELKLTGGMLMSASFDTRGAPTRFILHRYRTQPRSLWQRLWEWIFPPLLAPNSFAIHPRDEAGARALEQLRDEGMAFAAVALAQSRDHVRDFFEEFRSELAFYLGCMNLHNALTEKGTAICYPVPLSPEILAFDIQNLCDASLALTAQGQVVGTSVNAGQKHLILITGANQGGKSTFLRSVGLAQLMMQSGMFVGATAYNASLCRGLYTHYKREESAALESGKFDEELARMSEIVDRLTPYSMVLFNESFAATNEREGSEISLQILTGLMEQNVRSVCVTHLYDLAHRLYQEKRSDVTFLQPERHSDGTRTFRLMEGEPQPTSHGADLYRQIFKVKPPSKGGEWVEDARRESLTTHSPMTFDDEYQEFIASCQLFENGIARASLASDFSSQKLEKAEAELRALKAWLSKIEAGDANASAIRSQADDALHECNEHISRYAQRVFETYSHGARNSSFRHL